MAVKRREIVAFLCGEKLPDDVVQEIERSLDDPNSEVRRVEQEFAKVARMALDPEGPVLGELLVNQQAAEQPDGPDLLSMAESDGTTDEGIERQSIDVSRVRPSDEVEQPSDATPAQDEQKRIAELNAEFTKLDNAGCCREAEVTAQQGMAAALTVLADVPGIWKSFMNMGLTQLYRGHLPIGMVYLEQGLAVCQKQFPQDRYPNGHEDIAWCLLQLGGVSPDSKKARACFEKSLQMARQLFPRTQYPNGHRVIADALSTIGTWLLHGDKLDEASTYLKEALEMRSALEHEQDPLLVTVLSNWGMLWYFRHNYDEAQRWCEEAVLLAKKLLPSTHPVVGRVSNNLGTVLLAKGKHSLALPHIDDALLIARNRYPSGHPSILKSGNNLAMSSLFAGDQNHAFKILNELHKEGREHLRYDNQQAVATIANNLGLVLTLQDRLVEAEWFVSESLAWREKAHPNGHSEVAIALHNRGYIRHRLRAYSQARADYVRSLEMWDMRFGEDHPFLAICRSNLSVLHREIGNVERAEALDQLAIPVLRQECATVFTSPRTQVFLFDESVIPVMSRAA